MPKIASPIRFNAFYQNAVNVFRNYNLAPFRYEKARGASLYRYVNYRNSMPQAADAGKTLWLPVKEDLSNRWTGWGQSDSDSAQGLYFSNEFLAQGQPFPELDHYMKKDADPDAMVAFYKYEPGVDPTLITAPASELRSMFLFTNNKPLKGLDLKLYTGSGSTSPLLEEILKAVRANNPEVLGPDDTLKSLYTSEDADFCRALGNACLKALGDVDCFETLSVRDLKSANTVMRATPMKPLDSVDAKGRASFFINGAKVGEGVYTVSDMIYNVTFEDVNAVKPFDMPTRAQLRDTLIDVGDQLCGNMMGEYKQLLKNAPPNADVERVGERLFKVQTSLKSQDFQQAIKDIADVQGAIRTLDVANNKGLQANEVRALKMSESVMGSLAEMTRSIELANQDIDGHKDIDPGNVDISDPEPDLLDPATKDLPGHH